MGAEQRISASAFTHRGDEFTSNTGNYLLDGRQPFDFELDNSRISIIDQDRSFFFAVCDTKFTDALNTSVSAIKELKKLHGQIKTGARDIKSKTEMLGECLVVTEDILYETAGYADVEKEGQAKKPLEGLNKKLDGYDEKDGGDGEDEDDADAGLDDAGSGDGYPEENAGPADESEGEEDFDGEGDDSGFDDDSEDDADDDDADEDEEGDDGYDDADDIEDAGGRFGDDDAEPGDRGFSAAGFILSDKKGSILAQGGCEAFMLRGGSLRVLSGGGKKVSVPVGRRQDRDGDESRGRGWDGAGKPYAGRSSDIFEPREGDVYMLCTSSVVNAVGEDNIDRYLSMEDDLATVNSTVLFDAVSGDPSSNMTCIIVRIDELVDDEAPATAAPGRRGADFNRQDTYGYDSGAGAGAYGAQQGGAADYRAGGQYAPKGQNSYDSRYQNQYDQKNEGAYGPKGGAPFEPKGTGPYDARGGQYDPRSGGAYGAKDAGQYDPRGAGAYDARNAGAARQGQGGRQAPGAPPYQDQDPRAPQIPYQNRDAFTKRATSRFETPPPRKFSFANNRSLMTSIFTTALLFVILILSFLYFNNRDKEPGDATASHTTTTASSVRTTAAPDDGEDGEVGRTTRTAAQTTTPATRKTTTTTETTTQTTTTEPPEEVYVVKSGDTLMRIAQRYYGNANASMYKLIMERNNLSNDKISIGDKLIIPNKPDDTTTTTAAASNDGGDSGDDGEPGEDAQGSGTTAGRQSASTTRRAN